MAGTIISHIKKEKFKVLAGVDRTLPEIPKVKFVTDFDDLIDRLEYSTSTIFDLLWLYNMSGLMVEKVVEYRDPDEHVGIRVAYTIFGTYVKENDTDKYFPEAETGAYNLGSCSSWGDNFDMIMWMDEERTMVDLPNDIKSFYDTSELNI